MQIGTVAHTSKCTVRREARRHSGIQLGRFMMTLVLVTIVSACNMVTGDQILPPGISNPKYVQTAEGAADMALAAKTQFQYALTEYLIESGLLTDELRSTARNIPLGNQNVSEDVAVDSRDMPYKSSLGTDRVYGQLQSTRGLLNQALGALKAYDPDNSVNRRAELYALQGYAVLYLADLFCSGVPLSTLDFGKDFTYKPGSETDALYQHAIALFDTALSITHDSVAVVGLASVGKGRALLALGRYADAESAVKDIPVTFAFEQRLDTCTPSLWQPTPGTTQILCSGRGLRPSISLSNRATVVSREGELGLPYFDDPRTLPQLPTVSNNINGDTVWFPKKFTKGGISVIRIADGVEAQLIMAEAALAANQVDRWSTILNTLRTTGSFTTTVIRNDQGDSVGVDTTYALGAAQVVGQTKGIRPLPTDSTTSATPALRRDVLFSERAFWLYLTGHRQGDIRRLARRYSVNKYPRGVYPATGGYGENIDAPIPTSESPNPYFRGCFSRD